MAVEFPTEAFGLQNAIIIDKSDIYRGLPQGEGVDSPIRYSELLGTPVLSDLTLEGGTYTDQQGRSFTFGNVYFDAVVMNIVQEKNMVITNIQGRDGSVKEYIGLGDYQITINAVLNFPNGRYDRDAVSEIKGLLTAPVSIKCVSWFLQLFDIDEMVITNYNVPQEPGYYSRQIFVINGLSNAPVELRQL